MLADRLNGRLTPKRTLRPLTIQPGRQDLFWRSVEVTKEHPLLVSAPAISGAIRQLACGHTTPTPK